MKKKNMREEYIPKKSSSSSSNDNDDGDDRHLVVIHPTLSSSGAHHHHHHHRRRRRNDDDDINDGESYEIGGNHPSGVAISKEGSFELPIEYTTENGFQLLRDAEVMVKTTIPPSRVGGPWSGTLEGRSTIIVGSSSSSTATTTATTTTTSQSSSSSSSGSLSLEYKSSSWSIVKFGLIRGQELFHPLITIGGNIIRGGTTVGVLFYHNATYLHAMLLDHSMYSLMFRHIIPNTNWIFESELTRRQVLNITVTNTTSRNNKLTGTIGWDLRRKNNNKNLTTTTTTATTKNGSGIGSSVNMSIDVYPKISKDRQAHLFFQIKPAGIVGVGVGSSSSPWQIGASVFQYLHSSAASIGLGLRMYSIRGLEWVLSWKRGDAVIRIPILISRGVNLNYTNILQMTYLSMVSFFIQEGIAEMWGWKALSNDDDDDDETATSSSSPQFVTGYETKSRDDASLQRELMTRQAKRRRREEIERDGLVIQKAVYQVKDGDVWDVTIPLQFWVTNSSLNLPAAPKSDLLGFYDVTASLLIKKKKKKKKRQQDKESKHYHHSSTAATTWWGEVWNDFWDVTNGKKTTTASSSRSKVSPKTNLPIAILEVEYKFMGLSYCMSIQDDEELQLPNPNAKKV